jgi:adenosylhomocysteine nucleosidase
MKKIGLMSAMPEEFRLVASVMTNVTERSIARRTFLSGELEGKHVVAVMSRLGKVAAAQTATTLIEQFNVSEVIFTGVAGSLDPSLGIGDIVVASELIQHDMDASGIPIFERYEIPLLGISRFRCDEYITKIAVQAAIDYIATDLRNEILQERLNEFAITAPKVYTGLVASGDQFIAANDKLEALRSALPDALCVEMEGAAVAQASYEHDTPFAVIRSLSDRAGMSAPIDFPRYLEEVAAFYTKGVLLRLIANL